MSQPRGFGLNGKSIYGNICKPEFVFCNFVVDSANGNGLGIRSLKSNGYIENVFMHTSATPGSNNGFLNPNPASGIAQIQFKNNFNYYLGGFNGFVSPLSGSNLTSVSANVTYVITSLGTASLAQWQAKGFPLGFTPAVGAAFVATASGSIGGSASVKVQGVSGVTAVEAIGDANQLIANSAIASNSGARVMVQFLGATNSSTTTLIPVAPADGTVVAMSFWFDASSVTVDGI